MVGSLRGRIGEEPRIPRARNRARRVTLYSLGSSPLLDGEPRNPPELADIPRDQTQAMRDGGGGEPQIGRADHDASGSQIGTELGMDASRRQIDGKQRKSVEDSLDEGGSPRPDRGL